MAVTQVNAINYYQESRKHNVERLSQDKYIESQASLKTTDL